MTSDKVMVLPSYISDGMILQRNEPIVFKGKDAAGTAISVTFNEETVHTTAEVTGAWSVTFSEREAGGPFTLQIRGSETIMIKDVYIGEVWLIGGQSNMELPVNQTYDEFKEEIDASDHPLIREFHLEADPVFDRPKEWLTQGKWKPATQKHIQDLSSLGFFYAKKLQEKLTLPIGIYQTAVGGTPIEAWMSEETLHKLGDYDDEIAYWKKTDNVSKETEKDMKNTEVWYSDLSHHDSGLQDSPKWMEEAADTSDWTAMAIPVMFKDTELNGFSGVVWFRKTFDVRADQLDSDHFRLRLGSLINGDETYLNGKKVGGTEYRYPPRKYVLEKEDLNEGRNTLVIRLMIDAANGGFIPTLPYQLELDDATIDLEGEWLYKVGHQKETIPPALFLKYKPASEYKGLLYPLKDVAFKGALYYQGESNARQPAGYKKLLKRMVRDWRQLFDKDLPFYYVQLANYVDPAVGMDDQKWAELRYEQDRARFLIDNAEMIPAYDCGISCELHPYDKKTLAHRLAQVALSRDYGIEERYENLELDYAGKSEGLIEWKVKGLKGQLDVTEKPPEIEVRVADAWMEASISSIDRDMIQCRLPDSIHVDNVSDIRYAWRNDPAGYLYDTKTQLPLLPFLASLQMTDENDAGTKVSLKL
ncbi:sialate O-acetylesterase [Alkalibacterium subtropicum]|uniref:Sialate O-acetylesterase n=1 Tax=Alkalibacterium subtropicum TaxID=753702 RepID=A0A1I1IWA4_9LACT|nr:sialate O-acetylesterase [Alkalibacterium subtropicum]SFC38608.1 sialate O-acetylesterase [Alkalibacterium subtropicum]